MIDKLLSKSHLLIGFMFGGILAVVSLFILNIYFGTILYMYFVGLSFMHYKAISKPAIKRLEGKKK